MVWWLNKLSAIDCSDSAAFFTAEQIFLRAWEARAFLAFLLRLLIFLRIEYDYKNADIFFGKQADVFASRRGTLKRPST